jgi:hypothetical protein
VRTVLSLCILSLSACSAPAPPPTADTQAQDAGRPETESIQAADAVGYDGTAIRGKVDAALDQNDRHTADIDAQVDAQSADPEMPEQE